MHGLPATCKVDDWSLQFLWCLSHQQFVLTPTLFMMHGFNIETISCPELDLRFSTSLAALGFHSDDTSPKQQLMHDECGWIINSSWQRRSHSIWNWQGCIANGVGIGRPNRASMCMMSRAAAPNSIRAVPGLSIPENAVENFMSFKPITKLLSEGEKSTSSGSSVTSSVIASFAHCIVSSRLM